MSQGKPGFGEEKSWCGREQVNMMGNEAQQLLCWQNTVSQLQRYVMVHCHATRTNVLIYILHNESVSVDGWAHTMCRSVSKFRVTNTLIPRILLTWCKCLKLRQQMVHIRPPCTHHLQLSIFSSQHTKACIPAPKKMVSIVHRQEVGTCFTPLSVANCFPAR